MCDNRRKTEFPMRPSRLLFLGAAVSFLAAPLAWPQAPFAPKAAPSVPLVLAGGTVVDVTDWGHSAKDLPDAVVIIRDGRITNVGSRMAVFIPKNARVIDCTGKFLIPGLIDGFAGMNSQGQADADLYMGVTTVVAVSDARRGAVDFAASPSPHH
jgi:predicted amidohydrolase YtcJ